MINTLVKNIPNKQLEDIDFLINSIYAVPQWEKINEFSIASKSLFSKNHLNVSLYKKYSTKNAIEKYSIRAFDKKEIATMIIKSYKDCIYIISIDCNDNKCFNSSIEKLLQVAIEKSLEFEEKKEVKINLYSTILKQRKMDKILSDMCFIKEENQSSYEKEMFGTTYKLKSEESIFWHKRIKQMPILKISE